MKNGKLSHWKKLFVFPALLLVVCCSLLSVNAQKRDSMTNEEDMIVRETQEMDARMQVYVKVIDRRLLALSDANAAESKQAQKDSDKWGALRTGTHADLLFDIEKTLTEAIDKIDDVAARDQKNPLFAKSVHILADACTRWTPQLKTLQTTAENERVLTTNAIDDCSQIIEASAKIPKDVPKDKKKKNE